MFALKLQGDFESADGVGVGLWSSQKATISAKGLVARILSHAMKFWDTVSPAHGARAIYRMARGIT